MRGQQARRLFAHMYDAGRALLKERGFIHYEISNFSLPGRQSLHNINYWKNGPYMGFGPSAASYENGVRKSNTADFAAYSAALERNELPVDFSEQLTGMAAGKLILNESVSPYAVVGGVLIMGGVYWINGGRAGAGPLKKLYYGLSSIMRQ